MILVAGPWAAALQRPQGRGGGWGPDAPSLPRLRQLARQLDLTDAQQTQIQGYLESARAQLRALRDDASLSRDQRIDRAQQIVQQTRDQIRAALTPEQQTKAEELRRQAENRLAARRERIETRMLTRLADRLDLTDAQKSQIETFLREQRTQMQAIRDNASLSASQKREQIRSLRQQTQDKVRSVLTAQQQAQIDRLRERAQDRFRGRRRGGPRPGFGRGFGFRNPLFDR